MTFSLIDRFMTQGNIWQQKEIAQSAREEVRLRRCYRIRPR